MVLRRSLLAVLLSLPLATAVADTQVRVRVAQGLEAANLSGRGLQAQGQSLGRDQVRATARSGEIHLGSLARQGPVRVRSTQGEVGLAGRRYPGELALIPQPGQRLDVVNFVPLEAYVERTVAGEVYADWPAEVLKAQAVITRTYALHQRSERSQEAFDLEASVLSQRYLEGRPPQSVRGATGGTRGEYLSYRNQPILAAFHASAGGRTASAQEVWGRRLEYLRPVDSPDDEAPNHFWSFEIPLRDLASALRERGLPVAQSRPVRVVRRSESGRVEWLEVGEAGLSGRELRQVLGGRAIRSTLFEVREVGEDVRFLGSGSGHGVGLSQWGALELARRGKSYRVILAHYYPGTRLERLLGQQGKTMGALR